MINNCNNFDIILINIKWCNWYLKYFGNFQICICLIFLNISVRSFFTYVVHTIFHVIFYATYSTNNSGIDKLLFIFIFKQSNTSTIMHQYVLLYLKNNFKNIWTFLHFATFSSEIFFYKIYIFQVIEGYRPFFLIRYNYFDSLKFPDLYLTRILI